MENMILEIAVNGINLNTNNNYITVMLKNVVIYDKIIFTAEINMETKYTFFKRDISSIKVLQLKEGLEDYDLNLVFDLIETTQTLWWDYLKSKPDGYQQPDEPMSRILDSE